MTWRELFSWRPRWWHDLSARVRQMTDGDEDATPAEPRHARNSKEREQFWAEFRAGQREADQRAADRKILTPVPENGTPK
jgi:hypothetical protein